ncbi:MAG: DUF1207 domain-containing protein [Ignavibacteriales bacterium]|nr:DUF1207 domain-containing protein [Ignavibacteriales bacterium]
MKKASIFFAAEAFLLSLCLACGPMEAAAQDCFTYELLPRRLVTSVFTADARAHRLPIAGNLDNNSIITGMGGSFPVSNISYRDVIAQFSGAGTIYSSLEHMPGHFRVATVDFFVDAYADVLVAPAFIIRGGFGHTSQHLADDASEIMGFTKSINYVRDYVQAFAIHSSATINGSLYAGAYYSYDFIIDTGNPATKYQKPWLIQCGGEGNYPLLEHITAFAAFDLKLRSELHYGTTQSFQIGIKVMRPDSDRALRFAYTYRAGLEDRGQFYDQRGIWNVVGVYFDW